MAKKRFFTKVSPRAVEGIRRAYAPTGAKVSAILDPSSGLATVVVETNGDTSEKRKPRQYAAA